jgi:PE-PPE domain
LPVSEGPIKNLPVNTSVSQGVTILQSAINQQLFPTSGTAAPSVAVLGYSQSAVISSLVMQNLASGNFPFQVPATNQLGFTLLGDPMNPMRTWSPRPRLRHCWVAAPQRVE